MKKKVVILSVLVFGLLFSRFAIAQDEKFGSDPEKCRVHLSTYSEYFNQKNYVDAYPSWTWCFHNCPEATRNIYVQGATLIEHFISKETDLEKKNAYVDTLMMVYDNRIKYFGQKANVLGRKAISMLRYRPEQVKEAYDVLSESFELGGNETEYYVLEFYMSTSVVMCNTGVLTKENIVDIYSKISDALNYQIANEPVDNKREKLVEVAKKVEDIFVSGGFADCETVIKLYTPKFAANPTDIELAKKILSLLDAGKSDECKLSDLYMSVATLLFNNEKSASFAHSIAQAYLKRKEAGNSEQYYNEAIKLESDLQKKADMYYELGLLHYGLTNDYVKARAAARNAIACNPNHGKAYMLVGRIYASGARGCGETAFDKKVVYCLIVDQFVKARNADPSVASEANEMIGRYASNFPKREEAFWINVNEGDVVTIGCWINETTTVRFSD